MTTWSPPDTVETWFELDDETGACVAAMVSGEAQKDPSAAYAAAQARLAEERAVLAAAAAAMPDEYFRDVVDEDGDATGERVLKRKYAPQLLRDAKDSIVLQLPERVDAETAQAVEAAVADLRGG